MIKKAERDTMKKKKCKFKLIGIGRNRKVYEHGDYVIKVPLNKKGEADNMYEAETFKKEGDKGYIKYARCRLLKNYLVMIKLKTDIGSNHKLSEWTDWVDCAQVGYDKKGNLLAYDYGWF